MFGPDGKVGAKRMLRLWRVIGEIRDGIFY